MEETAEKVISRPLERSSRTFGTDELNICEFPLASPGRAASPHENTLVFEDHIRNKGSGENVHRKLMVSASEAFGLPTPADSDVLLVLMHLTNLRNGFTDRTIHFTRYELVKRLGWDQSGKSYRRIEESLQRWVNITLNYNRAWWDRDGRRWQNKSFHILESIDLRGRGNSNDDGISTFTWNQIIFESFQANNIKRLDLDTYFQLKSFAAKQAYRFLDKRFYRRSFDKKSYRPKQLEFELKTFACEHVGLSRSYDSGQLKRKLQPAIEELEAIRFLKVLPRTERYFKRNCNKWFIRLIRESDATESRAPIEIAQPKPIEAELVARGLHAKMAGELVETFSEQRIREKIDMLDWLVKKGGERSPKNPVGYLMAAIRKDYQPPQDFGNRRVTLKSEKTIAPSKQARVQLATEQLAQVRLDKANSYFANLSKSEQHEIESKAIAKGNRFRVETYQRLKESDNPLWRAVLDHLIADYLSLTQAV